jgi:hypothetical protein
VGALYRRPLSVRTDSRAFAPRTPLVRIWAKVIFFGRSIIAYDSAG